MISWLKGLFSTRSQIDYSSLIARFGERLNARYDSAELDPDMERWWAQADHLSPGSSNSAAIRKRVRSRARYECIESNSVAKRIVMTKAGDVIGPDGPKLQITTDNAEFNKEIESKWQAWVETTNLVSKLRTAYQAKIVDGETFLERIRNPQLPDDGPQIDVKVTEADMWTNPFAENLENEDDGLFFDDAGNLRHGYRLRQHPGDMTQFDSQFQYDTVDASNFVHWFRSDRPGQTRGMSEFVSGLSLFAQLRRYRLAVLAAAETAAEFSGIIYNDGTAYSEKPDALAETLRVKLERRVLMSLPAGWKFNQVKAEQPTADFDQFSDSVYKEIGGALRTPLNIVTGSSRDYNFASGRLDYILYWMACDEDRADCQQVVLRRLKDWWLEEALAIPGYLPSFGEFTISSLPHRWMFAPRRPIDELKEAQADEINFNLGFLTDEEYAYRRGIDPDTLYQKQQEMVQRRTATGLRLPGATGVTNEQRENAEAT